MARVRQEIQASSSSLITHLIRRNWQASQGQAGIPVDGDPKESGVSKPLLLKLPEYVSVWILPGRPVVENRVGLGAMAMGAVLEMALGIDILKVEGKKQGRQPQISSFDLVPAAGVSGHLAQDVSKRHGARNGPLITASVCASRLTGLLAADTKTKILGVLVAQ